MQSKNVTYHPQLDHLRFFAALLILVFHVANNEVTRKLHFDIGVPLFFCLSGYLFFRIADSRQDNIDYWKFIYNRALRIYPLILFLFLIMQVLMRENAKAADFINLLTLHLPGGGEVSWWNGDWGSKRIGFNWWTVGVEFTFYMIFPFLFRFYREYGVSYLLKLTGLILLLRTGLYYSQVESLGSEYLDVSFNYSVFGNLDTFLIGMLAGACSRAPGIFALRMLRSKLVFVCVLVTVWSFLVFVMNSVPSVLSPSVLGLLCAFLILSYCGAFSAPMTSPGSRILATLGQMSFSIYLLHLFVRDMLADSGISAIVQSALGNMLGMADGIAMQLLLALVFYLPATLMLAYLTFNLIEKPFLNMRVSYFRPPFKSGKTAAVEQLAR